MTYSQAPLAYRAASLETAACLWEAVLEMEAIGAPGAMVCPDVEAEKRGAMIRATREALGSAQLRLTVIGWTDLVDAAWIEADGCDDMGRGGQYGGPFDWEFVPGWIVANIDWNDPYRPTYTPSRHMEPQA